MSKRLEDVQRRIRILEQALADPDNELGCGPARVLENRAELKHLRALEKVHTAGQWDVNSGM